MLTENTELRSNVETLRGEYIAATNELDRTNVKQKKSAHLLHRGMGFEKTLKTKAACGIGALEKR